MEDNQQIIITPENKAFIIDKLNEIMIKLDQLIEKVNK